MQSSELTASRGEPVDGGQDTLWVVPQEDFPATSKLHHLTQNKQENSLANGEINRACPLATLGSCMPVLLSPGGLER